MKLALVLVLLLTLTANAQKARPKADSISVAIAPTQLTRTDTVQALHNLFQSRRSTGGWLVGGSAFFTALTGIGTLADNNGKNCGGYYCPDAMGSALIIGIGTAPAWIPGWISIIRFNKRKEIAVIEAYKTTQKLPLYVQRKLVGRFYNTNYRFQKKN
jgi:hypothetical protein